MINNNLNIFHLSLKIPRYVFSIFFTSLLLAYSQLAFSSTETALEDLLTDGFGYKDVSPQQYHFSKEYRNCEIITYQKKANWKRRVTIKWDLGKVDWSNVTTRPLNGGTESAFTCLDYDNCISVHAYDGDGDAKAYKNTILDNGEQLYFLVLNKNLDTTIVKNDISEIQKNCSRYSAPKKIYGASPLNLNAWEWSTLNNSSGDFTAFQGLTLLTDKNSVLDTICSTEAFKTIQNFDQICLSKVGYYPEYNSSWYNQGRLERLEMQISLDSSFLNHRQRDDQGNMLVARTSEVEISPVYIMGVPHSINLYFESDINIISYWHLNGGISKSNCQTAPFDEEIYKFCEYPSLLTSIDISPMSDDYVLIKEKMHDAIENRYGEPYSQGKYDTQDYWNDALVLYYYPQGRLIYYLNTLGKEDSFATYLEQLAESRIDSSSGTTSEF